ncbi:MAG: class I SAM-dependent methyltransferase [bacterium]|nr:class I SAM-dependent methyltransferase [bacterium]
MNRWTGFYSEDPRVLSAPRSLCSEYAAVEFKKLNCHSILDLGCGVGRDSFYLASQGLNVFSMDSAYTGLSKAQSLVPACQAGKSRLIQGDALSLPFSDACFDGIYCFGLLHEFLPPDCDQAVEQVLKEASRVLRDQGLLVLAVLAGDPTAGLPHVSLFTREMTNFEAYCLKCLEINKYYDIGCTGSNDYLIWRGLYKKVLK